MPPDNPKQCNHTRLSLIPSKLKRLPPQLQAVHLLYNLSCLILGPHIASSLTVGFLCSSTFTQHLQYNIKISMPLSTSPSPSVSPSTADHFIFYHLLPEGPLCLTWGSQLGQVQPQIYG